MSNSTQDKHTLITNLEWVTINGIRTYTHALLLTDGAYAFGPSDRRRYQVRGFGTDSAWPVFDLDVPSIEYTLADARSGAIMLTDDDPAGRPLISGAIMQIKDGPRADLVVSDRKAPLQVDQFMCSILQVWDVLPMYVRRFWTAPNMPTLHWVRVR